MLQKRMNEDSQDNQDATLCLEKDDVLRQAYYKYAREDGLTPKITECWRFCMKLSKGEKRRPEMRLLFAG